MQSDLFLFTAAKKYGHKLYITKENKERLGKLLNHFLSTNQVLFYNKPSEKTGLVRASHPYILLVGTIKPYNFYY